MFKKQSISNKLHISKADAIIELSIQLILLLEAGTNNFVKLRYMVIVYDCYLSYAKVASNQSIGVCFV